MSGCICCPPDERFEGRNGGRASNQWRRHPKFGTTTSRTTAKRLSAANTPTSAKAEVATKIIDRKSLNWVKRGFECPIKSTFCGPLPAEPGPISNSRSRLVVARRLRSMRDPQKTHCALALSDLKQIRLENSIDRCEVRDRPITLWLVND